MLLAFAKAAAESNAASYDLGRFERYGVSSASVLGWEYERVLDVLSFVLKIQETVEGTVPSDCCPLFDRHFHSTHCRVGRIRNHLRFVESPIINNILKHFKYQSLFSPLDASVFSGALRPADVASLDSVSALAPAPAPPTLPLPMEEEWRPNSAPVDCFVQLLNMASGQDTTRDVIATPHQILDDACCEMVFNTYRDYLDKTRPVPSFVSAWGPVAMGHRVNECHEFYTRETNNSLAGASPVEAGVAESNSVSPSSSLDATRTVRFSGDCVYEYPYDYVCDSPPPSTASPPFTPAMTPPRRGKSLRTPDLVRARQELTLYSRLAATPALTLLKYLGLGRDLLSSPLPCGLHPSLLPGTFPPNLERLLFHRLGVSPEAGRYALVHGSVAYVEFAEVCLLLRFLLCGPFRGRLRRQMREHGVEATFSQSLEGVLWMGAATSQEGQNSNLIVSETNVLHRTLELLRVFHTYFDMDAPRHSADLKLQLLSDVEWRGIWKGESPYLLRYTAVTERTVYNCVSYSSEEPLSQRTAARYYFHKDAGLLARLISILLEEAGDSSYRTTLSACVESSLRGAHPLIGVFAAESGLVEVLVESILSRCGGQAACDSLAEIVRFNAVGLANLFHCLAAVPSGTAELRDVLLDNPVDSVVLVRALILTVEWLTQVQEAADICAGANWFSMHPYFSLLSVDVGLDTYTRQDGLCPQPADFDILCPSFAASNPGMQWPFCCADGTRHMPGRGLRLLPTLLEVREGIAPESSPYDNVTLPDEAIALVSSLKTPTIVGSVRAVPSTDLSLENRCCVNTSLLILVLDFFDGDVDTRIAELKTEFCKTDKTCDRHDACCGLEDFKKLLMPWARQYRQWQRDARLLEFTCQIPHQVFVSFLDVLMDKMG
ncbi:MAG: hypothetical protein KVP17_003815 [Porospora cf. gigantea B]|uniref:uncharacterized protein n=1 Tax=Porospora cf. gigantea B TaxID=2853592 RepID=UPI0035719CDC|nr:MAG: hypothetical protein KVP17_003815 [Porospora cf. gigantea B]